MMDAHHTHCGLPGIDLVPFGTHACHFYAGRQELVAALVPYFLAGLRGNERCIWITAPPLPASEAIFALRAEWDGVDDAMRKGALRIADFDQWYTKQAKTKGVEVIQSWIDEEQRALAEGYRGLRITGNTSFLSPGDWSAFMEYERTVTRHFKIRRIVALCSYALAHCDEQRMSEVLHAHHSALECREVGWSAAGTADWPRLLSRAGRHKAPKDSYNANALRGFSSPRNPNTLDRRPIMLRDRIETITKRDPKDAAHEREAVMEIEIAMAAAENAMTPDQLADLADAVDAFKDRDYGIAAVLARAAATSRRPLELNRRPASMSHTVAELRETFERARAARQARAAQPKRPNS